MQHIWDFFENMNECVYVSDPDTYELVYMNKKLRKLCGFKSCEELSGKKCHEIIQNCSTPCVICNNDKLREGSFREWNYYNPIFDKYFAIKDTLVVDNGKRYRLEIAIGIGADHQGDKFVSYRNMEALVNEGLRVALQAGSPDTSIQIELEYLGKALNCERTYIFERNAQGGDDNTYEWVANGVTPEIDNLQNLPPEICANWYRNFREDKNIVIKNLDDIKDSDPLQYDNLKRQNIHSLVVVPLYDEKKIIGFYGVDNPPVEALDYTSNMLQIMGHFIVSSMKQRNLVRQLETLSFTDSLTRLGNRYAMETYIVNSSEGASTGVVYCDITGLKRVNDDYGHSQGDALIIRAADAIRKVFEDYGMFRIGGDEMLVICYGISQDDFNTQIEQLKYAMHKNNVEIAIGSVWREKSDNNMDRLISEAEALMYKDKAAYYKMSGHDRRK
ncbi:MAG: diguanylate cyclase [Lachnospiraceae bacterium]|nr:diguanylate cyclase [Lachnospiraceae bacterium]